MTKVEHYFKSYPASAQCFETADEFLFHTKPMAEAHAATLKDKKVTLHNRTLAEAVQEARTQIVTAAELVEAFEGATTVEALEALLPEGEKRKTVLAAFEKRKDELQAE